MSESGFGKVKSFDIRQSGKFAYKFTFIDNLVAMNNSCDFEQIFQKYTLLS